MANDFKRMWTKAEIEDTYELVIDYDGTRYVSYNVTKEQLDNIKKYKNIRLVGRHQIYFLTKSTQEFYANTTYSATKDGYNVILTLGYDEGNDYYILVDRDILTTSETFENLVRVTPTDVSIIEDEGKLELMLEHDGEVLAVNDTPNQFLQRRLDKESFHYNPNDDIQTYNSLGECLTDNIDKLHKGMFVWGNITYGNTTFTNYFIITRINAYSLNMVPITPIPTTLNNLTGFVNEVDININGSSWQYSVRGFAGEREYAELVDIGNIDSIYFY